VQAEAIAVINKSHGSHLTHMAIKHLDKAISESKGNWEGTRKLLEERKEFSRSQNIALELFDIFLLMLHDEATL